MMKWTEALKKAPYALPARLCLAALLVSAINWIVNGNNYMSAGSLNWRMSDLVLFLIGSATFFPVSYLSAARIQAEHPPLSARRRYILMFGSLVVAIIVSTVIRLITV
jgi:hypothetical protein